MIFKLNQHSPSLAIQMHPPTPRGQQKPSSGGVMRQLAREPGRDRLSTPHELGEVVGLLIMGDQLSMNALASLESEDSRFEGKELELLTEADRDRVREAEIERLTNVILCRSQKVD
jgi:hypothetical protein